MQHALPPGSSIPLYRLCQFLCDRHGMQLLATFPQDPSLCQLGWVDQTKFASAGIGLQQPEIQLALQVSYMTLARTTTPQQLCSPRTYRSLQSRMMTSAYRSCTFEVFGKARVVIQFDMSGPSNS